MKKELHPLLAGKAPDYFSLIFEAKGEALLFHGDEAAARLSFPAIDRNIQRQAGILVIQPVWAQVADKVVQCCDSMDNQLLLAQRVSNYFVIVLHGNADGCREAFGSLSSFSRKAVASNFRVQVFIFVFFFVCVMGFLLALLILRSLHIIAI